jgi:4-aminobutyrate aminotransferase
MENYTAPKIIVDPPGSKAKELIKRSDDTICQAAYKYVPLVAETVEGSTIKDVDGNIYIDFTAGIGLASVGYSQPSVIEAINRQAHKLIHIQQHGGYYEPIIQLAEKLKRLLPGSLNEEGRFFFLNSGSEANEAAIKLIRFVTKKINILSFFGSFHGRTYGAISLCGESKLKKSISPLVPGILQVPFPYCYRCYFGKKYPDCNLFCLDAIQRTFDSVMPPDEIAMVITEPVQAVGGVVVPPKGYFSALKRICDDNDICFAVDEVYTGFGRTGKLFAIQHENITPDIMTVGKSIAAGMPLSAVIAKREIMDEWPQGAHGSTFGGCPVSCAAAIEVLNIIEKEKLVKRSAKMGDYIMKRLKDIQQEISMVGDVRGKGMLIGIELIKESDDKRPATQETKEVLLESFKHGLLLSSGGIHGNVIRLSPPLVITKDQTDNGIEILENALRHCTHART